MNNKGLIWLELLALAMYIGCGEPETVFMEHCPAPTGPIEHPGEYELESVGGSVDGEYPAALTGTFFGRQIDKARIVLNDVENSITIEYTSDNSTYTETWHYEEPKGE